MGILDFLFGNKTNEIADFTSRDAVIIDVRTSGEFQGGHIKGAKNIPLNTISQKTNDIKKWNKPVIVCCQSGMRSGQAASILKSQGIEVINGGGWQSLNNHLS